MEASFRENGGAAPAIRQARIDRPAPDFTARTTMGVRSLADYRGKWLVLFSHPADFTPVCASEFVALERAAEAFRSRNCELLGLSVDSLYSHLAWVQSIEERFGVRISFPIIEDVSLAIAEAYGMVHEDSTSTATVRSLFFIDPDGIVRALIHYPMQVGRAVDEIRRVLAALQATHGTDLATPEGWHPGEPMLRTPPLTVSDARDRQSAPSAGHRDWYYAEAKP